MSTIASEWSGWQQTATDLDPEADGPAASNWSGWQETSTSAGLFTEWWVSKAGVWQPALLRTLVE